MTSRGVLVAAVGILSAVALLIPTASGAAPRRVRPSRPTTTVAGAGDGVQTEPAASASSNADLQPVLAEATRPGFTFPPFTFNGFTFPGFSIPTIVLPGLPGLDAIFDNIRSILNSVFHTLCSTLGGSFCASP